jgi:hypothetical protein
MVLAEPPLRGDLPKRWVLNVAPRAGRLQWQQRSLPPQLPPRRLLEELMAAVLRVLVPGRALVSVPGQVAQLQPAGLGVLVPALWRVLAFAWQQEARAGLELA